MRSTEYATIADEYREALGLYLRKSGEEGLHRAYEIGRRAIALGLGCIDLYRIHESALDDLGSLSGSSVHSESVGLSSSFFVESLSPYEMTHRGFHSAIETLRAQTSELAESNRRLEENEIIFRLIMDNITDMIAILDNQGKRLYNSPSYNLLLGDPERLRGTDSFADVHPDDRERIRGVFHKTLETGVGHREEYRLLARDGSIRYIESQGNVINSVKGIVEKIVVVSRDVTGRKNAEEALRMLARRIVNIQEDERRRIARELHDDVCQRLTATKMELESLKEAAGGKKDDLLKKFQEVGKSIANSIDEIRRISANLRPSMLDHLGLVAAVRKLCGEFEKGQNSPRVTFRVEGMGDKGADDQMEIALYRIVQEALANVAKHSDAEKVTVTLASGKKGMVLDIVDDGKGFDPAQTAEKGDGSGYGLISMRERALLVGGRLVIHSKPRKGTEIHVEIPHRQHAASEEN